LSILSQFNEGRDAMLLAIQEEILKRDSGHKGYDFEDVATGGGGTLLFNGIIPYLPDELENQELLGGS
jgi:hypothetical protein